jgi:diaminopimelate epimerase
LTIFIKGGFLILIVMYFYKYHGAGNDFIIINNLNNEFVIENEFIKKLCHRRLGIGADGLMLLNKSQNYDFEMQYFNSDGFEGSMCGNGGRCIVAFAKKNGLINEFTKFKAIDGEHEAYIQSDNSVKLKMSDVENITSNEKYYFLNTGSPHYVVFVDNVAEIDVFNKGKQIRYSSEFSPAGTNVNFAEICENYIKIRTYERGVEDETLACGTGTVATALSFALKTNLNGKSVNLKTLGGDLKVYFNKKENVFTDIWLEGPTEFVFEGSFE